MIPYDQHLILVKHTNCQHTVTWSEHSPEKKIYLAAASLKAGKISKES